MTERRWWLALALISGAALVLRIAYVLALRDPLELGGDAFQYHHGANFLVDGRGFIGAHAFIGEGATVQTAQHPPLYTLALAVPSVFGARGVLAHQLWSCAMGAATVGAVGLVGRRAGNMRAGLIAAGIAAVYPNLWLPDGLLEAATLSGLLTALTLLAAYRLWAEPSTRSAIWLGLACGSAALARSEALAFLPLIVIPWAVAARSLPWRRRGEVVLVSAGVVALLLSPWFVYNATRFENPVLGTSTGFDLAVIQGNCDASYFGPALGYGALDCIPRGIPNPSVEGEDPGTEDPGEEVTGDETEIYRGYREEAFEYISEHKGRVPLMVATRVGRTFGLYDANSQIALDELVDDREGWAARAGLYGYYLLVALSIPGVIVLRRRRVPISPLIAVVLTTIIAVAVTFGQTRYRVSAEVVPVLLAAFALDAALTRSARPHREPARSISARL